MGSRQKWFWWKTWEAKMLAQEETVRLWNYRIIERRKRLSWLLEQSLKLNIKHVLSRIQTNVLEMKLQIKLSSHKMTVNSAPNRYMLTPESYMQTPNSYVQTLNSYVQTPNSYMQTPNSYMQMPNSYIQTRNSYMQTPWKLLKHWLLPTVAL